QQRVVPPNVLDAAENSEDDLEEEKRQRGQEVLAGDLLRIVAHRVSSLQAGQIISQLFFVRVRELLETWHDRIRLVAAGVVDLDQDPVLRLPAALVRQVWRQRSTAALDGMTRVA